MKILINEHQFNLIKEQTEGLESFVDTIINKFPEAKDYKDVILKSIINSGCKKIEFAHFKFPASGVAMTNGVMINKNMLGQPLYNLLFVIFHEIAHSYQYRKFGEEKMMDLYTDNVSIKDAAKFMKEVEIVADEFATRKCREFIKLGLLKNVTFSGFYNQLPLVHFESFIKSIKDKLESKNLKTIEEKTSFMYNMIKSEIE
jgi:hypothetical protein